MENTETCPKCGGQVVQVEALGGSGQMVLAKARSALSLGIMRGSTLTAHTCVACGYTELYATNPEVLK
ncbi:MAG: hypothetical protein ACYC1C_18260 [Chloroflexota bacterium]|nr:hypothetical protein [Dehalococcoidales bacterium]